MIREAPFTSVTYTFYLPEDERKLRMFQAAPDMCHALMSLRAECWNKQRAMDKGWEEHDEETYDALDEFIKHMLENFSHLLLDEMAEECE